MQDNIDDLKIIQHLKNLHASYITQRDNILDSIVLCEEMIKEHEEEVNKIVHEV